MIEEQLAQQIFKGNPEKTFIDKVLGKNDTDRLKELIQKDPLERKELLEILYLLGATESKLVNYTTWDRYIMLKFFVWVREFVKICELMYDYKDDVKKGIIKLSKRAQQILDNNERLMQHNAKFLIDLYLNMSRTTLSINGVGWREILTNKYEINYPSLQKTGDGTTPAKI